MTQTDRVIRRMARVTGLPEEEKKIDGELPRGGRSSGKTEAGNARKDSRTGGHRVAHGGPRRGESVCSPGRGVDSGERREEPAFPAADRRGSVGGPLRAGAKQG